jgi:hypothetical protein
MSCTELILSVMDLQWDAKLRQSDRQDHYGTIRQGDPERGSCRVRRHDVIHLYIAIDESFTIVCLYFACYLQARLLATTARAPAGLPFRKRRRSPLRTLQDDRGKTARTGIRRPLHLPLVRTIRAHCRFGSQTGSGGAVMTRLASHAIVCRAKPTAFGFSGRSARLLGFQQGGAP